MPRIFDEQDLAQLKRVLDSGSLGSRGYDQGIRGEFERKFAARMGAKYGIAMSSAMAGLHMAVSAAGVGPGAEVICDPIVQFGAMATMYHNGYPVFADVDPQTHNIEPESVKKVISPYTKAIIATNLWGQPCELDKLREIADEHGLVLIEDCAHAIYATHKGKYTGTWGHIGVFSFQMSKQMATGDGSIVITSDDKLFDELMQMCSRGSHSPKLSYIWNYRMTELVAAVALVQLDRTLDYVRECIENANIYSEALKDCEWLQPQGRYEDSVNTYHLYAATFYGDKYGIELDAFKKALSDNGCSLSFGYNNSQPAYLHPMFKDATAYDDTGCPIKCSFYKGNYQYKPGLCPNAEELMPRLMITGVFAPKENIQRNTENLRKAIRQSEER
ncbi:TPA: DegT/DnrJ/EryC1/StrS family aminotransferase [Candidatus Poribacteria bacterium]|nr:DegT/DnrJ/EryC1/StrS family aminotransferase [Candidatus Poribacteria bacterium]